MSDTFTATEACDTASPSSPQIVVRMVEEDVTILRDLLAWAAACGKEEERHQATFWMGYLMARWDAEVERVAGVAA